MVRTASFLVLSVLAVQAAIVQALENGVYRILDSKNENALAIGPVPPVYPPLDVPLRLLSSGSPLVDNWRVQRTSGDRYTISAGRGGPNDYKIVPKEDNVFVSAVKSPQEWSVTQSSDDTYVIQLPYEDKVATGDTDEYPPVTLRPADGSRNQRWRFVRMDRDFDYYHKKGSRNRLCMQEQW